MPPLSSVPRCIACVVLPSISPFGASLDTAILSYPPVQETGTIINIDANVAEWVSHEETKALVGSIPHGEFAKLSILDKLLIALYGISQIDTTQEAPIASISDY